MHDFTLEGLVWSFPRLRLLITVTLGHITENQVTQSSSRRWGCTITQDFDPNQYIWNHWRFILLETFIHSYVLSPIMVSLSHCIPTPCRLCDCMVVCLVLTKMRVGLGYLSGRPSSIPVILYLACLYCLCISRVVSIPPIICIIIF